MLCCSFIFCLCLPTVVSASFFRFCPPLCNLVFQCRPVSSVQERARTPTFCTRQIPWRGAWLRSPQHPQQIFFSCCLISGSFVVGEIYHRSLFSCSFIFKSITEVTHSGRLLQRRGRGSRAVISLFRVFVLGCASWNTSALLCSFPQS